MFTFSEMLALVESESSFVAYVCHRRPGGYRATSDLVFSYISHVAAFGFRTKKNTCERSKQVRESVQRSASVRKFHAYDRLEVPSIQNLVHTKYSGFTVPVKGKPHLITMARDAECIK